MLNALSGYFFFRAKVALTIVTSSSALTIHDPIEQYDLGFTEMLGALVYPAFLHIFVIAFLVCLFAKRTSINIFGYLNQKCYNFLRDLFLAVVGRDRQVIFPYFYYLFLFILFCNLGGMLAWSFTLTAQLPIAFFFSVVSLGGVIILSVEQKGWRFLDIFKPTAPKLMIPFLVVIEFISFLIRFISLAVRLLANMVAGHALLKILLLFWILIVETLSASTIIGGLTGFIIILTVVALELLIAFLQAYVFIFLMLVYTNELL